MVTFAGKRLLLLSIIFRFRPSCGGWIVSTTKISTFRGQSPTSFCRCQQQNHLPRTGGTRRLGAIIDADTSIKNPASKQTEPTGNATLADESNNTPTPTGTAATDTTNSNTETTIGPSIDNPQQFNDSAFQILAGNICNCLHKSDLKRDTGFDGASTGWTSWVDNESALRLKNCMDAVELPAFVRTMQPNLADSLMSDEIMDASKRDEMVRWIRWVKACPTPLICELSPELRQAVSATIPNEKFLQEIDSSREEFLQRIGCRLFVLPSGSSLAKPLRAPPGAMVHGKVLLGGVTRFRVIGSSRQNANSPPRRAGDRTVITSPQVLRTPSWLQYGGPERSYEAIDAGVAVFMEVLILPKGLSLPLLAEEPMLDTTIAQMKWNPNNMLDMVNEQDAANETLVQKQNMPEVQLGGVYSTSGGEYVDYLETSFASSVGGLQPQVDSIIRRVLDGRVLVPASGASIDESADTIRRNEMEALLDLGLQPVRGLLLYGKPGTGKTLVAREISKVLNARPPKIVAAPELLSRWVGGSEKLVREMFAEAEGELKACNGDATKSALHVVVIDEIDAVFRKRSSSSEDSGGEITRASAVNQILSKLDGVSQLGNVLVIGMTNRRELLDPALLRPGRLEVQIEIPLPDEAGRREILKIHFEALRRRGLLSMSLCSAIDGHRHLESVEDSGNEKQSWRENLSFFRKRASGLPLWHRQIHDLAAERWTGGYSGADIAGLVRASGSFALARARNQDGGGLESLLITLDDVAKALKEVKQ